MTQPKKIQSWHPRNLFNLWCRSLGPRVHETVWKQASEKLFRQRWASKALLRGYHGDYINEKIFKRWYLPPLLSEFRASDSGHHHQSSLELNKWAKKDNVVGKEMRKREEENEKGLAPLTSLMWAEVERRIDVVVFRSCFAHSVYEARRLVVHGDVLLNGKKVVLFLLSFSLSSQYSYICTSFRSIKIPILV